MEWVWWISGVDKWRARIRSLEEFCGFGGGGSVVAPLVVVVAPLLFLIFF